MCPEPQFERTKFQQEEKSLSISEIEKKNCFLTNRFSLSGNKLSARLAKLYTTSPDINFGDKSSIDENPECVNRSWTLTSRELLDFWQRNVRHVCRNLQS